MDTITQCCVGTYDKDLVIVAGTQCTREAAMMLTSGCIHEHLDVIPVCQVCEIAIRYVGMYCGTCEDLGHECSTRIEIGPLS